MFIAIANVDLFGLRSIDDFVTQGLVSVRQLKQLFQDNHGKTPLAFQLEQFVLDHILQAKSKRFARKTFRDESLVDLYASFLNDLCRWPSYTHRQIVGTLTLIQGLLCQIERTDRTEPLKLNEAFIHACSILAGGKETKKAVLFHAQQYPHVIDYVVQTIFQHRHLYATLIEEKPQEMETIEETRIVTSVAEKNCSLLLSSRSIFISSKNRSFPIR